MDPEAMPVKCVDGGMSPFWPSSRRETGRTGSTSSSHVLHLTSVHRFPMRVGNGRIQVDGERSESMGHFFPLYLSSLLPIGRSFWYGKTKKQNCFLISWPEPVMGLHT